MTSASSSRRSSGTMSEMGWPIASDAVYPYGTSIPARDPAVEGLADDRVVRILDDGRERGLRLSRASPLGDVAHDADEQTSSACGILPQRDLDWDFITALVTSGELDALPRDVLLPRLEVSPERGQVAGAKPLRHDLGEFTAQELVLGISEELRRGVVLVLDPAPLIDRQDAVRHRRRDGPEAALASACGLHGLRPLERRSTQTSGVQ